MEVYSNDNLDYLVKLSALDGQENIEKFIKTLRYMEQDKITDFMEKFFKHFSSFGTKHDYSVGFNIENENAVDVFMLHDKAFPNNMSFEQIEKVLNFKYKETVDFAEYYSDAEPYFDADMQTCIRNFLGLLHEEITMKLKFKNLDSVIESTSIFYNDLKDTKVYKEGKAYVIFAKPLNISPKHSIQLSEFCDVDACGFSTIKLNELKFICDYKDLKNIK